MHKYVNVRYYSAKCGETCIVHVRTNMNGVQPTTTEYGARQSKLRTFYAVIRRRRRYVRTHLDAVEVDLNEKSNVQQNRVQKSAFSLILTVFISMAIFRMFISYVDHCFHCECPNK